jgi:hypothetical protein
MAITVTVAVHMPRPETAHAAILRIMRRLGTDGNSPQ